MTFGWEIGRPGAAKLAALLGRSPIHRARDLLRESMTDSGAIPTAEDHLALTYTTSGGAGRRFDSMWATNDFVLAGMTTHYEEALAAGGDHALIVADLEF